MLRFFLIPAALAAMLLVCAGCATSGNHPSGSANESGPPSTASGPPASDRSSQGNSCSAPASAPRGSCGGCSVNCGDKEAICVAGEEWPSGGPSCQKTAMCACR